MKNSARSFIGALTSALVLGSTSLLAQAATGEAGLIGKRYAGADFSYDNYSGSGLDETMGATAVVNLPVTRSLDLNVGYSYFDTSGTRFNAIDKALSASLLTHQHTEYGTGYFAGTVGHGWNRLNRPGFDGNENGAFWGVRAGYEMRVAARTAVNLGVGFTDAFDSDNTRAQVLRYSAEVSRWFSRELAGVASVSYRQIKSSPDAVSYTLGLRWGF
jgi:hypothetical protein